MKPSFRIRSAMSPAEVLLETRVADSSSSLDLADPSLISFVAQWREHWPRDARASTVVE